MRIAFALPDRDFDVTEVAVPWKVFRDAGVDVAFATEDGKPGAADPVLLGTELLPQLRPKAENVALYRELEREAAFQAPLFYAQLNPEDFDALVLPGGHAPGMRQYLESIDLRERVWDFMQAQRVVGAICHGVVVLARTRNPASGRSILHGRRVTALTKTMEGTAWLITSWKMGSYYRTYPEYVEDEVKRALGDPTWFDRGPLVPSYERPFTVRDGNLVTARWPGDARGFAEAVLAMAREQRRVTA